MLAVGAAAEWLVASEVAGVMRYPGPDASMSEIIAYSLHAKRVEPVSIKGTVRRENVAHRFEINVPGAKTVTDLMAENITANNALLKRLTARSLR